MRLNYYTSWSSGAVHYCPDGSSEWLDAVFESVAGFPDWKAATLDVRQKAEFVVRDDANNWDNNQGRNYFLEVHGADPAQAWSLRNGRLGPVSTGAPILIVSDLDRTLFGHEFDKPTGRILDPNDDALSEFKALWYERYAFGGSHLVYCTGRDKHKALRTLADKGAPRPSLLICGVGTEIYEVPHDLPLCDGAWASDASRISIVKDWSQQMLGFDRDFVWNILRKEFLRFRPYDGDSPEKSPYRVSTVYPIDDNLPEGVPKMSNQDFEKVIQQVIQSVGPNVCVVPSGNNGGWSCVDFLPCQAGKLSGLNFSMRFLGIACERTIACGDSGNDEGLYRSPGTRCVAVGNAMDALLNILRQEARDGPDAVQKGRQFETNCSSVVYYANEDAARGVVEALNHFWPNSY